MDVAIFGIIPEILGMTHHPIVDELIFSRGVATNHQPAELCERFEKFELPSVNQMWIRWTVRNAALDNLDT